MNILKAYYFFFVFSVFFLACGKHPDVRNAELPSAIASDNISNQHISCFEEDEFGYMWIGTNRGVNKYNGYSFQQFFHTEDSLTLSSNQAQSVFSDSKGRLWVGTTFGVNLFNKQGVFRPVPVESYSQNIVYIREDKDKRVFVNTVLDICEYDTEEDRFVSRITFPHENAAVYGFHIDEAGRFWSVSPSMVYCHDGKTFSLISTFPLTKAIHYSFLRKNGELWLAAGNETFVLDTKSAEFIPLPSPIRDHPVLSGAILTMIYPYDDVSLLINTQREGLFLFNTYSGEITHQSDGRFPFTVPETDITVIYRDKKKNLWIGSYDQGFSVHYEYKQRFNANDHLRVQMEEKSVISTAVDQEQNLWIVTRTHGLKVWSPLEQRLRDIDMSSLFIEDKFFQDRVNAIFIDSKNTVWLQTNGKIIRCRYSNNQLVRDKTFNLGLNINSMTEDYFGTIWAAGSGEYLYFLNETDEFESIQLYPKSFNFTNGLISLSNGKLLIASFGRTLRIIDPRTKEMEEVDILSHIHSGVFFPIAAYEDSRGDVWIGTYGNGLFRFSLRDKTIEPVKGLTCNDVSSIIEDAQSNLWIGTLYGLSKYDSTTGQITSYYKNDGIGGNQFNERSSCRLNNGSVVLGGTHGLTIFDPIDVTNRSRIPLFIEEMKIHNRKVVPEEGGIIETEMIMNPPVTLAYNQNSFQISYAALDYSEFHRVKYAYKLEGFDPYWIEANTLRQAFYSNLPAGKYTFKVKSMSTDNSVEEVTTSISLQVKRAPWLTIPMLVFYLLVILTTVFFIFNLVIRLRTNRRKISQAVYEKEQEKKINQVNMSYFANISHEFRTPLTMIAGPINQLGNDPDINDENRNLLMIVQRSVDRMLRLINQLMDFNKLESDVLSLKIDFVEVTAVVKEQLEIFRINAEEKQISMITSGLQNPFRMWADTDVLQKVLSNLLSNALKFSKPGGVIDVRFDVVSREDAADSYPLTEEDRDKEYVQISVGDTGIGISESQLEDVFKKYYQVSNGDSGHVNWGTGIGLYFSRKLVELHHGYIKAANKLEGGSLFSFILPVNMESYANSELNYETGTESESRQPTPPLDTSFYQTEQEKPNEKPKNTLLVVDDDTEITYYLKALLSPAYNVVTAFDAEKAWKLIVDVEPDLIISDVMMPETDGLSFCLRLKENISTSHIPVILLTAKVTINDQIEGLNVGANAYVTKPFDPSYLLALVKSQLKNRDYSREILSGSTKSNTLSEEMLNSQDMAFMDSLYNLMETELSNPELNISRMTEILHISRTKFYYKVKGLTGENPNVFFKTYKLNRAAELIRERKYTMSEIADLTGFSTASHFSSSFKKKFGVSPSEFS
ncbi:hybrid sensor histidine kinase/response regulator transcription factor [Proteiniphilum sp. UBA5384]|uniref:hybrid sensor histidine kinase/response regulator transcription factor n=1 Tax=Proteiniphilum sp. UBA5384 TaxID=1947279 RepID=UPI0025D9DED8|nr:hybrid sensor histidine kinase/response regulator transcription factor [Proteiniphilum sp. UBA5384]